MGSSSGRDFCPIGAVYPRRHGQTKKKRVEWSQEQQRHGELSFRFPPKATHPPSSKQGSGRIVNPEERTPQGSVRRVFFATRHSENNNNVQHLRNISPHLSDADHLWVVRERCLIVDCTKLDTRTTMAVLKDKDIFVT